MTITTIALLSLVVVVSAFIQGAVGVGFALIIAPVFSLVNPELVPVVLLIIMLPLNFLVMFREREHLDKRGTGWITVGRTVGGGVSASLSWPG